MVHTLYIRCASIVRAHQNHRTHTMETPYLKIIPYEIQSKSCFFLIVLLPFSPFVFHSFRNLQNENNNSCASTTLRSIWQMIKMMVTIVIVFTICWLPFNVLVVSCTLLFPNHLVFQHQFFFLLSGAYSLAYVFDGII